MKRCKEYLSFYWVSLCKEVEDELDQLLKEELKSKEKSKSEETVVAKKEEKDGAEWSWERWKQHFGETQENERLLQALKVVET